MRVMFADGSFLEVIPNKNGDKMSIVLCGFKNANQLTMSSSELDEEQSAKIAEFLLDWVEKRKDFLSL